MQEDPRVGPTPKRDDFVPEAVYTEGLLEDRDKVNAGVVPLGFPFLDDCLGGVYPRDLFLITAESGVGKTDLAIKLWEAGVEALGDGCIGLFLEAFKGEVSYRQYFRLLSQYAPNPRMDYASWVRGEWKDADSKWGDQIRTELKRRNGNALTLYKTGDFGVFQLKQQLESIRHRAKMVVLDHLHVVDTFKAEDENSTQSKVIRILRDFALDLDLPVVVCAHTKKRQSHNYNMLTPSEHDLHGTSNLIKTVTQAVSLARADESVPNRPELSPTLVRILKDRKGRKSHLVAKVNYNRSTSMYEDTYSLGSVVHKEGWQEIEPQYRPYWAKHCRSAEVGF